MSFWAKIGMVINDLGCFRASCQKHGIEYTHNEDQNFKQQGLLVQATLRDTEGGSTAYLVQDGGGYRVIVDNDPNYSSITRRLGRNGGKLTRDYTVNVAEKQVSSAGGYITSCEEQPDGGMIVKGAKY